MYITSMCMESEVYQRGKNQYSKMNMTILFLGRLHHVTSLTFTLVIQIKKRTESEAKLRKHLNHPTNPLKCRLRKADVFRHFHQIDFTSAVFKVVPKSLFATDTSSSSTSTAMNISLPSQSTNQRILLHPLNQ